MERKDNILEELPPIRKHRSRLGLTERVKVKVGKYTITYNKPIGINKEPRFAKAKYIDRKVIVFNRAKKRGIKLNFIYNSIESIEKAINDKLIQDIIDRFDKKSNLELIKKQITEFQLSKTETIKFGKYPGLTHQEMFNQVFSNTVMRPEYQLVIGLERLTNGVASITWRTFNARTANLFNTYKAINIEQGEQVDSWTIQFENISTLVGLIFNQFPIGTSESHKDKVKKQFSEIDEEAKRIFPIIEEKYNTDELKLNDVKKAVVDFVAKHIFSSTKVKIEGLISENMELGNTRKERNENRKKIINWIKAVPKFEKKEKKSGAFFPYLNDKTSIDLTRYGIYNTVEKENYSVNCLIHALQMSGRFTAGKIENLKQYVKNHKVPVCKLKLVANALKCSIRIKHLDRNDTTYGNYPDTVEIGLIAGHYFLVETVYFTTYSIKNYQAEKHRINFNKLIKHDEYGTSANYIDSFKCIKLLLDTNQFTPITLDSENIQATQYYNSIEQEINSLEYPEEAVRPTTSSGKKATYSNIGFADFEASTNGEKHKEYMCCYVDSTIEMTFVTEQMTPKDLPVTDGDFRHIITNNIVVKFLERLRPNSVTYFHNLSYDFSFMADSVNILSMIKTGSMIKQVRCLFNGKMLTFKDSYSMIAEPLKKFAKMFNLKIKKEIMPYKLYSENRVQYYDVGTPFAVKCLGPVPDKDFLKKARKYMKGFGKNSVFDYKLYASSLGTNDKKEFLSEAKKFITNDIFNHNAYAQHLGEKEFKTAAADFIKDGRFDHMGYAKFYCLQDCRVLKEGFETFRKWINLAFDLDPVDFVSLPALSMAFFQKSGCFTDVYELSGTPRAFIQRCLQGGRCMTRDNEKHFIHKRILDFDGVSLYPSAMARMGYLQGVPKVIPNDKLNMSSLNNVDGYFIEITNVKINKRRHFPLQPELSNGIKNYTNDITSNLYVDKVAAEDLIKFQDATFDIVRGYYFDQGRNYKIQSVIKHCFETRLQKKKEKNPIEVVYKLLMNAAYGKTIQKPIDTVKKFSNSAEEKKHLITKFYNLIEEYNDISYTKCCFTITKAINMHFSHPHIGIEILSMSKRIMNEVMCLAEDIGVEIYYQDTDSMHIPKYTNDLETITVLSNAFKDKYGRELVGESLGQFHTDFKLSDAKNVESSMGIFLGKKCYYDQLVGVDEDGDEVYGHHIRMKGVGEDAVMQKGDPLITYSNLFCDETVSFNLSEAKPTFGTNADFTKFTKTNFIRNISFGKKPVDEIVER